MRYSTAPLGRDWCKRADLNCHLKIRNLLLYPFELRLQNGAPGETLTLNPLVRSQVLYTFELREHDKNGEDDGDRTRDDLGENQMT